jgi:hypothetical protein
MRNDDGPCPDADAILDADFGLSAATPADADCR